MSDRNTEKVRERLREGKSESVTELIQRVPRANKPSGGDGGRKERKKKELADKTHTHTLQLKTLKHWHNIHTHISAALLAQPSSEERREKCLPVSCFR